jgi:hypothetical protein
MDCLWHLFGRSLGAGVFSTKLLLLLGKVELTM